MSSQVLDEDRGTRETQPDGNVFRVNRVDELYVTVTLESTVTRPLAALSAPIPQNLG